MMRDPKDPFELTRGKVFGYGLLASCLLAALIWIYVPKAPENRAVTIPLEGPGSQSASLAEPSAQKAVAAASGAENYTRFCTQCHGADGKGDTQMAKMMEGKVPNLLSANPQVPRTIEAVTQLILKGSASKSMPGFEKELGAEGAQKVAEFVLELPKSQQTPNPSP